VAQLDLTGRYYRILQ